MCLNHYGRSNMSLASFNLSPVRGCISFEILRFEMSFDFMCYLFCGLALGDKRWRDFICISQCLFCFLVFGMKKRQIKWAWGGVQTAFNDLKSQNLHHRRIVIDEMAKSFISPIFYETINSRKSILIIVLTAGHAIPKTEFCRAKSELTANQMEMPLKVTDKRHTWLSALNLCHFMCILKFTRANFIIHYVRITYFMLFYLPSISICWGWILKPLLGHACNHSHPENSSDELNGLKLNDSIQCSIQIDLNAKKYYTN